MRKFPKLSKFFFFLIKVRLDKAKKWVHVESIAHPDKKLRIESSYLNLSDGLIQSVNYLMMKTV